MNPLIDICVIIVTHNSGHFLDQCIKKLNSQTLPPSQIIIVDNASNQLEYLDKLETNQNIDIIRLSQNLGFSAANNIGFKACKQSITHVLFLNPDAFPEPSYIERLVQILDREPSIGAVSGKLLGMEKSTFLPTGNIDSLGISKTWYGRWYDVEQGKKDSSDQSSPKERKALCGASILCKKSTLISLVKHDGYLFNEKFFLYKEDIELSLRLGKLGYKLVLDPNAIAYHARGCSSRKSMSRQFRIESAKNDLYVSTYYMKKSIPYCLFKFLGVYILDI